MAYDILNMLNVVYSADTTFYGWDLLSKCLQTSEYSHVRCQWRKSVKIIGGDETEPSKVAHIKKRIVA